MLVALQALIGLQPAGKTKRDRACLWKLSGSAACRQSKGCNPCVSKKHGGNAGRSVSCNLLQPHVPLTGNSKSLSGTCSDQHSVFRWGVDHEVLAPWTAVETQLRLTGSWDDSPNATTRRMLCATAA